MHLDILWVDENYRRTGIGSKLLKAAEEEAKAEAAEQQRAEGEATASAKTTIMENPWEFLIVSAAFVASVLVIIFTGD